MSDQDPPAGADPFAPPGASPPSGAGAPRPARKKAAAKRASTPPVITPGAGPGDPGPRRRTPPPVDDAAATRYGFIVIGVTVVLGLLIFVKGVNNQERLDTQAGVTTTLPGIAGPPTSDRNAAPTTTTPGAGTVVAPQTASTKVAPADAKVLVANGVDPSKTIAGPAAEKLTKAGYTVTAKIDLSSTSDTTFVYYPDGFEADGKAIAKALELPESTAKVMPKNPPTPLNGAQFLVIIGKDHAT